MSKFVNLNALIQHASYQELPLNEEQNIKNNDFATVPSGSPAPVSPLALKQLCFKY